MPAAKVIKVTRNKPGKGVREIKIKMLEEAKKAHSKRKPSKK